MKKNKNTFKNYSNQKSNKLEKLATNLLKVDEKNSKLKTKQINSKFLNLF